MKAFASYIYSQGLSLRKIRDLLCDFGLKISHVVIWKWIQRIGKKVKGKLFSKHKRRLLIVNETKVRSINVQIWILAAIDPINREIVEIHVSKFRESIDVLVLLKECLRNCKGKPTLITDGGRWYEWPARRWGVKHTVLSGSDRNYIERWFGTLKDRLRIFDKYPKRTLTVRNFCNAFCLWYNKCRNHMSLNSPPSGGRGGFAKWLETLS